MAFCLRAFCRDFAAPSLSELLVWLRQYETPVTIAEEANPPAAELLSSYWDQVRLSYDAGEAPLTVRCYRAAGPGAATFAEELADFVADVRELADSPARSRVLDQLGATRVLVVVEVTCRRWIRIGSESSWPKWAPARGRSMTRSAS